MSRGLKNRHVQLIALGGTIGTGLFLGSGESISLAGPSILLAYTITGIMCFFIMRALGTLSRLPSIESEVLHFHRPHYRSNPL